MRQREVHAHLSDQSTGIWRKILRFGVVGGTAFIVDYGFLFVLTEFAGFNYLVSAAISFTLAHVYNYILSVRWVFDVGENHSKAVDFTAFMLLGVVGLGLNQLLMWLFVSEAGIHYMVSKLFVTAIVMVYNFITRKLVLERKATGK